MSSESVKVIVRCRPLNEREKSLNCNNILDIICDLGQCSIRNPNDKKAPVKNFFFDGAYDRDSNTEHIYNDICYTLVEGVTEGYNGTIFAYGQTGCGKSFTMQGITDPSSQRGVIPRAFDHIFETISVSEKTKYLIHASFLEIYNEEIRDLLGRDVKTKLDLKEHPEKGVYVAGLSVHKITCVEDCQVILHIGWKNRSTGSTLMNSDSSRSHSIFTIYLEMIDQISQTDENHIRVGKLNLVDLAGSERQTKTGASGDRFKEATKINLSLSALGNVISALVDSKVKHVPYRDSKLTRLLQDSLGGNTKTLMIACLSPADNNYDETLSTLRYANRAKNIQNKPRINEDPKDTLLREYQLEIKRLKELLQDQYKIGTDVNVITKSQENDYKSIENDKAKLQQEYEVKLQQMEAQYNAEAADKAKLIEDMKKLREFYDARLSQLDTSLNDLPSTEEFLKKSHEFIYTQSPVSLISSISEHDITTKIIEETNKNDLSTSSTFKTLSPKAKLENKFEEKKLPKKLTHQIQTIQNDLVYQIEQSNDLQKEKLNQLNTDDLLKRLHSLEADMVGGEQVWNIEVKEKLSRRRMYAEERKRQLAKANAELEDEGIMVGIYENIQDELRCKSKLLQKQKQKVIALQMDIKDIQSEFEQDRSDYLETIRRQQCQINLLNLIIEKIQPCLRRDSNYHNIDKIKRLAKYDSDKNEWILPPMIIERTQLPLPNCNSSDSSIHNRLNYNYSETGSSNLLTEIYDPYSNIISTSLSSPSQPTPTSAHILSKRDLEWETKEDARLYAKLASRTQSQPNYFTNKRASQLLLDAAATNSGSNNRCGNPQQHQSNHILNQPNNGLTISNSEPISLLFQESDCDHAFTSELHGNNLSEDADTITRKPFKLNPMFSYFRGPTSHGSKR